MGAISQRKPPSVLGFSANMVQYQFLRQCSPFKSAFGGFPHATNECYTIYIGRIWQMPFLLVPLRSKVNEMNETTKTEPNRTEREWNKRLTTDNKSFITRIFLVKTRRAFEHTAARERERERERRQKKFRLCFLPLLRF